MILKQPKFSIYQKMLECADFRMKDLSKRSYVDGLLYNERSGLLGEESLLFPISKIDFPFVALCNLRLILKGVVFQMDTILLSPRFALIIEAKHYTGQVWFECDFDQVRQVRPGGEERIYDDPVLQVEEQKYLLELWLQLNGYENLPVETVVVMTNPNAQLKLQKPSELHKKKVITLPRLSKRFREISDYFDEEFYSMDQVRSLGESLLRADRPYCPNILERTKLSSDDFKRGVWCVNCKDFCMKRARLSWECDRCGLRDRNAHLPALKDYYLLFGEEISNSQLRWWLGLESSDVAGYLLKKLNLKKRGRGRSLKHLLGFDYYKDFDYMDARRHEKDRGY
ncbi:hypothetical protein CEY16_07000 [Halalkalibacillus sediminis]|uniref:NERD domain-containing protein n=1 Tax=Halalkalibacillus sediminis TaxID=2018042 RepID=A0A2I0QTK4_9BACI|nr:nuclease-related domain-containing protein [Halalkalibacillus sediminis]PKR77673.1 hypothetical protein CEY16_07000 [Halalkalibacillus sediminis]